MVRPQSGKGTATLTATYPGRDRKEVITYDVWDHATSVDDGLKKIEETLSPSGRVIRRVVKSSPTGQVLSDEIVGYDGGGDSPAYSRPTAGGTVTTYLGVAIYTGATVAYQHANLHGDIVGTTDSAGNTMAYTPNADEWGVSASAPASRLGWHSAQARFDVGGDLGLIRMGVRLYDAKLGRFLSVDPVEGGCANDYVYVTDPISEFDLDGRKCPSWLMGTVRWLGYGDFVRAAHLLRQGKKADAVKMALGATGAYKSTSAAKAILSLAVQEGGKVTVKMLARAFALTGLAASLIDWYCSSNFKRPKKSPEYTKDPATGQYPSGSTHSPYMSSEGVPR